VDAHIHLSDEEYAECIDEVIAEAKASDVVALVSNSMDLKTCLDSLRLAERYPGTVFAALGVHTRNVNTIAEDELQKVLDVVLKQKGNKTLVALGEIGLDSKYMGIWDKQIRVFDAMLHLAEEVDLPVIIHSRGTTAQIVDVLPSYRLKKVLLHWFSNPMRVLSKALEEGYYISEGPPTLYSKGISDVVRKVPLTNFLTETDGPVRYFRAPFNGKRTSPAFIPTVAKAVAEKKNIDVVEVVHQVFKNFQEFFNLKLDFEE
jgi:TatD DNase family protein